MTVPTKITDHSDRAIARLPDYLRKQINVKALLRGLSSARVDIPIANDNECYWLLVNDSQGYSYFNPANGTAAQIAAALTAQINDGRNYENFLNWDVGANWVGDGFVGTYLAQFDPPPPDTHYIIQDSEFVTCDRAIRTNYGKGIQADGSTLTEGAVITPRAGMSTITQSIDFKFDAGYPGPSFKGVSGESWSVGLLSSTDQGAVLAFLRYKDVGAGVYGFELSAVLLGGGISTVVAGIPEAYILDGAWHSLSVTMDMAGTALSMDLDSGTYSGSIGGLVTGATLDLVGSTSWMDTQNNLLSDIPNVFMDNYSPWEELTDSIVTATHQNVTDDYFLLGAKVAGTEITLTTSENT